MLLLLATVSLALASPGGLAETSSMSGRDPVGDELTCVGIFACTQSTCHDPAIDLTAVAMDSDGSSLTVEVQVLDLDARWECPPPASSPSDEVVQRVVYQSCGGGCGPSFAVFRSHERVEAQAGGAFVEAETSPSYCVVVNNGPQKCGIGSTSAGTVTWNVPLHEPGRWDLRGECFDTVFGHGFATPEPYTGVGSLAAAMDDFRDFDERFCL